MATVKEIYLLIDKESTGKWSMGIYDLSGSVSFGYCNSSYPVTDIPEEVLSAQVKKFSINYEGISAKIDIKAKEYSDEKKCEADGYRQVYKHGGSSVRILYSKMGVHGTREFAVVDTLAAIRKGAGIFRSSQVADVT